MRRLCPILAYYGSRKGECCLVLANLYTLNEVMQPLASHLVRQTKSETSSA